MRKSVAGMLCVTSAAMAWGLATVKPGGSEPGIQESYVAQEMSGWGKIKHIDYAKSEDDGTLYKALQDMTGWCGKIGLPAEVWVERNDAGKLEVLGRCSRTMRSEGP